MRDKEIRTLALNPGSRYVGIAVFHGSELVDWAVRSIREKSAEARLEQLKSILSEIAETHGVNCLVIKSLHPARSSEYLCQLTSTLKEWAKENHHAVREYTIKDVETFLLPSGRLNKRLLMEGVAAIHPFLFPELEGERQNRNPYLVRMFEAVALGVRCLSEMEHRKGRKLITNNHEEE